jgi:hypothetical protein
MLGVLGILGHHDNDRALPDPYRYVHSAVSGREGKVIILRSCNESSYYGSRSNIEEDESIPSLVKDKAFLQRYLSIYGT